MMRQRSAGYNNTNATSGNRSASAAAAEGSTYDFSSSDDDDEEQRIQASHPPSDDEQHQQYPSAFFPHTIPFLPQHLPRSCKNLWNTFCSGGNAADQWWVQALTITLAAIFTYSYNNNNGGGEGHQTNVQIAIMTVIVLVGATPFGSTHVLTTAIGAFAGGHNIIGATGEEEILAGMPPTLASYGWLCLLALAVSWVWRYIVKWKILDGYGGRLGTTTFLGTNLVMCTMWGPLGVVDWNRYYLGFLQVILVADEADNPKLATAWTWTEEAELVIGYVGAVVWLSAISGGTRLWNDRSIQQWNRDNKNVSNEPSSSPPPQPLNNVLIPCAWALFSMLMINMTQYQHAPGIYNGFAVGAYVGMASLQKIESIPHFASVGVVAAAWGLALTPIFVGFAGKAGFTAMCGHATHRLVLEPLVKNFLIRRRQQQQQQQEEDEERLRRCREASEGHEELQAFRSQHDDHHEGTDHDKKPPHPSIEVVNYTKQQRRQQQRLLHRQQQQEEKERQQSAPLHHRAWVAQSDHWEHPKLDETTKSHDDEEEP
jgi:hypothetical protein